MNEIDIITPTYNRVHLLPRLYESLQNQTNKSFRWLIVDDGSTDGTKEFISDIKKSNMDLFIEYFYKENGGKHTALNLAFKNLDSKLAFIVDSDDWLTDDAIDVILEESDKVDSSKISSIAFLGKDIQNRVIGKEFSVNNKIASFIEERIINKTDGDKAEVIYSECLKDFSFPEIEGEKFIGEDYMWIILTEKKPMLFINQAIYCCEYQEDGLSKNVRKINVNSPCGNILRLSLYMDKKIPLLIKCKSMLLIEVYKFFSNKKNKEIREVRGSIFMKPFAYLIFKLWSRYRYSKFV